MKDISKFLVYGALFLVPLLVLNVQNDFFFPYITGKNFGFRILVEVMVAGWFILMLYDAKYRPKFSWILGSFLAFLVVMFFANLFGESPSASFWSNFERMEGYVTLVHTFLFLLVAGSMFTTDKLWKYFFITNVIVAGVVCIFAFGQIGGFVEHRYEGFRADATLGNASYMAVYMLFSVFISLFLITQVRSQKAKYALVALAVLFAFMVIQTATRGTTLGLVGGLTVATIYVSLFSPNMRKYSVGVLGGIVLLVGGFIALKDSEVIQGNPTLKRVASISLNAATTRFDIWSMALEGVKERPLLGWGQSNYNYVFNKYYRPELYNQEAWFDRVHNIVMDWLIAGGILGLVAYLSILGSALYYIVVRPFVKKDDESFTVLERGILLGLLAGYVVHNLVVFDNIVSYIFFGAILAFIHSRVGQPVAWIETKRIDTNVIGQVIAPVVVLVLGLTIYMVNVPSMQAAKDIIVAFQAPDPETALTNFERALSRNSFGNQEIREQMTQRLQTALTGEATTPEVKERIATRVEEELLKEIAEKPGDARLEVFISSFYRTIGDAQKAGEHLAVARELSPNKQLIIFEQGFTELQRQDYDTAQAFFKEAFDLGPQFDDSRTYYAMSAIYNDQPDFAISLLETEAHKQAFATTDFALNAAYQKKLYDLLIEMFTIQIAMNPNEPQSRTNLSFILNEMGKTEQAIEVLTKAGVDIPSFKEQSQQFIASILGENMQIENSQQSPVQN